MRAGRKRNLYCFVSHSALARRDHLWHGVWQSGLAKIRKTHIAARCIAGSSSLVVFIPLRALNGFGNIRAQVGTGWIAFLNNVKYPPSITFLLLALGIDLTLLFAFSRRALALSARPLSPLMVFGATPLFFYLSHLYLYGFIGRTFFPDGTSSIPAMYPWWLLGLVILYPLCLLYRRFKSSQPPNSIWRFLLIRSY